MKFIKLNIDNIIICCGSHNCNFPPSKTTINYINSVIDILTTYSFNVYVRSTNSPDDDLCLMVKAKYFMPGGIANKIKPGGGGYCGLVRFLRNNTNVITNT